MKAFEEVCSSDLFHEYEFPEKGQLGQKVLMFWGSC